VLEEKVNLESNVNDLVGSELDLGIGLDAVSDTLVRYWCEAFEDSNRRYWQDTLTVAPPGLITSVCRLPYWPTDPSADQRGLIGVVGDALNRPESVVQKVDFTFDRDLRIGDHVRCVEKVLSVSPEKTTKIATGNFVRLERRYLDAAGDVIGVAELDFFKYARDPQRTAIPVAVETETGRPVRTTSRERGGIVHPVREDIAGLTVGAELAPMTWVLNVTRMVQMAYISRDFNPVHHDLEYAQANGLKNMLVQWGCYVGIFGRYLGHEVGPGARMTRIQFTMLRPLYAGETATVSGKVVVIETGDSSTSIEFELAVSDSHGVTTPARVWIEQ